jgi:predicted DNA-binding transcriptional regulator YafY
MIRLVSLLLMLLRRHRVDFEAYYRAHEMPERTYRRDIRKLRTIAKRRALGFTIRSLGGRAYAIEEQDRGLAAIGDADRAVLGLIQEFGRAMGSPVEEALRGYEATDQHDRFLRIAMPRLVEGSDAAILYRALRAAATARARVKFTYRSPPGRLSEREVEPYFVTWNSGRYYLVGYDTTRRDWRQFALDAFQGSARRSGTFKPRTVPATDPTMRSDCLRVESRAGYG